jgi:hypothetical protein
LTGFEDGQWNGALDAAGYPKTPAPSAPKPKTAEAENKPASSQPQDK